MHQYDVFNDLKKNILFYMCMNLEFNAIMFCTFFKVRLSFFLLYFESQ
jgi:hypothetical protein